MVSPTDDLNVGNLISDIKLSTVVPASITGEDKTHQCTNTDLAMKLHYITTVHFFRGDAAEGLTNQDLKKPMFQWLQLYYPICGRIRRHDGGGRPFIKCNDSGVRIVEAKCSKTMNEWLEIVDGCDHHRLLVYHQPLLAHDFEFTPLVFLQLTKFKCGGLCVGMRWAHMLGDAFSASECINMWGKIMANQTTPPQFLKTPTAIIHTMSSQTSQSLKQLDPIGDNWLTPNNFKMQMHTFYLSQKQLNSMISEENKNMYKVNYFEVISAVVWKSLAKIRGTKIVTVCKKRDFDHSSLENELPNNEHQVIGIVEAQTMSSVTDADPLELAKMIAQKMVDETSMIEQQVDEGNGILDFVVYGSNLTFVNLEEVNLHGLRLRGHRPVYADLSIRGVGDEGLVLVCPHLGQGNGCGKAVTVTLAEDQLQHLKNELRVEWGIF